MYKRQPLQEYSNVNIHVTCEKGVEIPQVDCQGELDEKYEVFSKKSSILIAAKNFIIVHDCLFGFNKVQIQSKEALFKSSINSSTNNETKENEKSNLCQFGWKISMQYKENEKVILGLSFTLPLNNTIITASLLGDKVTIKNPNYKGLIPSIKVFVNCFQFKFSFIARNVYKQPQKINLFRNYSCNIRYRNGGKFIGNKVSFF